MTDADLDVAVALVAAELGGVEVAQPRCRRCGGPAAAVPLIGDPPGPWCRHCRPGRRINVDRPWAAPRCRHGCNGVAAFYDTPSGGLIGPVCPSHAPRPCHWPRKDPT
jgi:hypothetical protein